MKNIIFVDVDGVLFPIISIYSQNYPRHFEPYDIKGIGQVILNPIHGKWLLDLAEETDSELIWLTFWAEEANKHIAPLIGLPELPVAPITAWKMSSSTGSWKAYSAKNYAQDRKFAQFDDENDVGHYLRQFGITKEQGNHVHVGPSKGLRLKHIDAARTFLAQ